MTTSRWFSPLAFGFSAAAVAALILGCETGASPNSTIRQLAANFTGIYENNGKALAPGQSGAEVRLLNLNQTGDRLEAFDNFDTLWKGTIGELFINSAGESKAPFTLEGKSQAGVDVTITGQFSGQNSSSGGGAIGTMAGTWIEPTLYASFFAQGAISTINTNSGGGGTNSTSLTVTANPQSLSANGQTSTLTANGGTAPFTWSSGNNGLGTVGSSGQSVVYTRVNNGNNTVTVTDGNNGHASVTISQP